MGVRHPVVKGLQKRKIPKAYLTSLRWPLRIRNPRSLVGGLSPAITHTPAAHVRPGRSSHRTGTERASFFRPRYPRTNQERAILSPILEHARQLVIIVHTFVARFAEGTGSGPVADGERLSSRNRTRLDRKPAEHSFPSVSGRILFCFSVTGRMNFHTIASIEISTGERL